MGVADVAEPVADVAVHVVDVADVVGHVADVVEHVAGVAGGWDGDGRAVGCGLSVADWGSDQENCNGMTEQYPVCQIVIDQMPAAPEAVLPKASRLRTWSHQILQDSLDFQQRPSVARHIAAVVASLVATHVACAMPLLQQ